MTTPLRKITAFATAAAAPALLMSQPPRARADKAIDANRAASLRAKLLALAAAQRERTDWEARRLHQLMRAVDEEHAHERAAALQAAAAEDALAGAERERAAAVAARDAAAASAELAFTQADRIAGLEGELADAQVAGGAGRRGTPTDFQRECFAIIRFEESIRTSRP